MIKKYFIFITLIFFSKLTSAQFTSCDGTANGSAVSAYAGWAATIPYTTMDQGASDVVGSGGMGTSVQICLESAIPKCGGSNDFLIIGDNIDGRAYAVWDDATAIGTCVTIFSEDGEAIVQTINACAGDFSWSWTAIDHNDPYTNPCDGTDLTPTATSSDCIGNTPVCATGTFGGLTNGSNLFELSNTAGNNGCLTGMENNAAWYSFKALTNGTITIEADPSKGNDDYDFAIWDNWDCPPSGAPIRCSWYLGKGGTGLELGETDNSEDETGGGGSNGYVQELNVIAGEEYMLLVDGYANATDPTFDLNIGGSATLDCGVLPVEYLDIYAKHIGKHVSLSWITSEEKDNSHFEIQKSYKTKNFQPIGKVNNASNKNYNFNDYNIDDGTNAIYYRIKQVDLDGKFSYSKIVKVEREEQSNKNYSLKLNKNEVSLSFYNEISNELNIIIKDVNGRTIFKDNINISKGNNEVSSKISPKLNKGLFFVLFEINGTSQTEKIIINY